MPIQVPTDVVFASCQITKQWQTSLALIILLENLFVTAYLFLSTLQWCNFLVNKINNMNKCKHCSPLLGDLLTMTAPCKLWSVFQRIG